MGKEKEGGINFYHAYLILDGSGSMADPELKSNKPKHKAVAEMVQKLIDELHDVPEVVNTQLTIVCYDGKKVDDIRLDSYDVKVNTHYKQSKMDLWDPIINHEGTTPIGRALAFGRELAEKWINAAMGREIRRAVIYLMSDGIVYPDTEPNGMSERQKIRDFNDSQEKLKDQGGYKGRIRLATVGYFQYPEGQEENEGRGLLRNLPDNPSAYFETHDASKIVDYILRTITR